MKISAHRIASRENMEDDDIFDVLFADDDDPNNNATATLEWLDWRFSVVPSGDSGGYSLSYGIPDWFMN